MKRNCLGKYRANQGQISRGATERLWRLATRLREMGVERFAVQLARPARQLDPQLLAKPAPQGAAQLWRELEELFPAFELRDA